MDILSEVQRLTARRDAIVRRVMAHEGYECVAQKFGIHKGIVQKLMDAAGQRVGQRGPKKRAS
jgi:hypothetical protein